MARYPWIDASGNIRMQDSPAPVTTNVITGGTIGIALSEVNTIAGGANGIDISDVKTITNAGTAGVQLDRVTSILGRAGLHMDIGAGTAGGALYIAGGAGGGNLTLLGGYGGGNMYFLINYGTPASGPLIISGLQGTVGGSDTIWMNGTVVSKAA